MYNPHNGKLLYVRGRIFIAWAHTNSFGPNNDHSGCTMISVDALTGNDRLLYFTFSPSHSLD